MGLSDLGSMVKEMHLKTITSDKFLPSTGPDCLGVAAFKRKIIFDRLYSGDRLYSRTKAERPDYNQISLSLVRSRADGGTDKMCDVNGSRPNGHSEGQKQAKSGGDAPKSRSTCRNQTAKPSATTTLWNMDICNMLGMSQEEIALSKEDKKESEFMAQPVRNKPEQIKPVAREPPKIEPPQIRVEMARGARFGAYEALVTRLRDRGRSEFFKGGPGCSQSCRDVVKTSPLEEIFNQRLGCVKYVDLHGLSVDCLRGMPRGTASTIVYCFSDPSPVPPHEEDDCHVERLVLVSYGDIQFPGIRRDEGIFVRLADINNDVIPGKDTRSLQSKCKRLDIQLHTCTDTELNLLMNFANSPQSKSHHMIGAEDAQRLLESLLIDRRRRKR